MILRRSVYSALVYGLACVFTAAFAAPVSAQQVAITFDDLPVHGPLPPGETRLDVAEQLLKVIQSEHLPAVYGMVNAVQLSYDPRNMAVLKAWRKAGQPLASHTYTHMNLNTHTATEFEHDIELDEPVLEQLMQGEAAKGYDWRYLRYPYLSEGDGDKRLAVKQWLAARGYKVAEVSLEFGDYLWNEPYARCMAKHDDAAIQHLHDTYLAAAHQNMQAEREAAKAVFGHEIPYVLLLHIGAFDARMFPELVAQMRADGLSFTTLPKAEDDPAYATPATEMIGGGDLQDKVARYKHIAEPKRDSYEKELAALCR